MSQMHPKMMKPLYKQPSRHALNSFCFAWDCPYERCRRKMRTKTTMNIYAHIMVLDGKKASEHLKIYNSPDNPSLRNRSVANPRQPRKSK